MNLFLTHLNFMPFIYGVVLFLSVLLVIRNFANGEIIRGASVVLVLWVGFEMHGDASDTRMGVAVAALLLDITWPLFFRR